MKAFVTGATGFIGGRVARKLRERGYEVTALVREGRGESLAGQGIRLAPGDVTDPDSLRAAMAGNDVVFHVAGWYKVGARDTSPAQLVNVIGTRNVLGVARELHIPRIIYTSTVAVFGDTRGHLADESYVPRTTGPDGMPVFLSEYDRTKWIAHYQVALPMMREGVPITVVMPGTVYGPGDPSLIGDLMRRFYLAELPVLPGPDTMLTYAHVDDIAEGHVLAAERGRAGTSYILAGPAMLLGEMFDQWAQVTGLPAPRIRVPSSWLRRWAPLMGLLGEFIALPEAFAEESVRTLGACYLGHSARAYKELGWEPRPLQEGLAETFAAIAANAGPPPEGWAARNRPALAAMAVAGAVGLLVYALSRQDRRS